MNRNSLRSAKIMGYVISLVFLLIHFLMYNLFSYYGVTPMAHFNIGSIIFYLLTLIMNYYGMVRLYIITTYLEVLAHMTLAIYYVGWNSGFQICLLGMNIMGFYSEYLSRSMKLKPIPGIFLSLLGMIGYIGAYIDNYHNGSAYALPDHVNYILQILWAIIVFVITTAFLKLLIEIAFRNENYLSDKAGNDELTGLNNRYSIHSYFAETVRKDPEKYWIAIIDIDDFKMVNDHYGHNYGDYVLKTIADLSRKELAEEKICRWGGEEFLIIGRLDPDLSSAVEKMENLRKTIARYDFSYEGTHIRLTITGGIAAYENDMNVESWIDKADELLYQGKNSGKNKIVSAVS